MRQWKEGIGYHSLPSLHYRFKRLLEFSKLYGVDGKYRCSCL